jgi:hypothetical protein
LEEHIACTFISEISLLPLSAGFMLGLFFDSEDGDEMFLQTIRLSLN